MFLINIKKDELEKNGIDFKSENEYFTFSTADKSEEWSIYFSPSEKLKIEDKEKVIRYPLTEQSIKITLMLNINCNIIGMDGSIYKVTPE